MKWLKNAMTSPLARMTTSWTPRHSLLCDSDKVDSSGYHRTSQSQPNTLSPTDAVGTTKDKTDGN